MFKLPVLRGIPRSAIHTLGLGVFDGLHKGHQQLISSCDTIMTFFPHPDIVFARRPQASCLTTLSELRYLCPRTIVFPFTKQTALLRAELFLDHILTPLAVKKIVVGYDYRFGYKREGSVEHLQDWATEKGIKLCIVQPVKEQNQCIKSGSIRHYIKQDQFSKALTYLGHDYLCFGHVIKGEGRGRKLGFPTANLKVSPYKLIPHSGVYKAEVYVDGGYKPCVVSIGHKPSFGGKDLAIEVHIPGVDKDLYGKRLKLFLKKKIRSQQLFSTEKALVAQIRADVEYSLKG